MAKVPQVLHDMLVEDWGGELTERIEAGYRGQRPVSMRVNTLKSTREEIVGELDAAGIAWHEVRWYPDALVLENVREETVMQLPMYTEGRIYLQSLSAMIPPLVLKTKPGDSVLDMAAAPGGKTTQICALAGGRVTVTACERDHVRAQRLAYNLRLQGAKSATVMEGDARNLNDLFRFDAVLLDAPCTGSGTLQLDVETEDRRMEAGWVRKIQTTQRGLLKKGLSVLRAGGSMVYATCSVLRGENEDTLDFALDQGYAELVPLDADWGHLNLLPSSRKGTLTICPDGLFEGFFVAALRRTDKPMPQQESGSSRGRKRR